MTMGPIEICNGYRMALKPDKQISILAQLNNCSQQKIIGILERNNLMKQWTEQDNMELLEMAAAGKSQKDLAAHYGTTVGNIAWRLRHLRDKAAACKPAKTINAEIAKICDVPEPPKPKPDYTESLLETLREAEEFREPVQQEPLIKQQTVFDRAHDVITLLRHNAKDQDISVNCITLTINTSVVDVSASNADGESIGWHKKIQPAADRATD